jgi:hypothetical protein
MERTVLRQWSDCVQVLSAYIAVVITHDLPAIHVVIAWPHQNAAIDQLNPGTPSNSSQDPLLARQLEPARTVQHDQFCSRSESEGGIGGHFLGS